MNYNNNINFGSIYKYNVTLANSERAMSAHAKLANLEIKDAENYTAYQDFVPYGEMVKTGVSHKVHIAAADKYDSFIESVLKQKGIDYTKQSFNDALNSQNIYDRIVLSEHDSQKVLVSLDTEKVDKLFKEDKGFYVGPNGSECAISNRYQGVQDYIRTGRNINATKISLREENGKPILNILDGRHRFAVMRDMGMKKIKFALDENSLAIAAKYNLISE